MMKKYLFVLLSLLLTSVAYADEMELTPTPEINCDYYENVCYVYVTGEGVLTVSVNGVVIPDFTNPLIFEAQVGVDQEFEIMATAQLEGYLESYPAFYNVYLPGIMLPTPVPTFEVIEAEDAISVQVVGDGDLFITVDGMPTDDNPIVLTKQYYEYSVYITAEAQMPGYLPSEVAILCVDVPALPEPEQAQHPEATWDLEDGQMTICYYNPEPDGVVYYRYCGVMYPSGDQMDWTDWMEYTDPIVLTQPGYYNFEAYVEAPGKTPSDNYCMTVDLPMPEGPVVPDEPTESPTITESYQDMSPWHTVVFVTIDSGEEDCEIYWRSRVDLDGSQGEWSEWNLYTGPFAFIDDGHYFIEAYAIAPGKLESEHIIYDFWFSQPETPWDFMEDGIFYVITGPGQVGVTRCSDPVIFYYGDMVIPSTVTHKGVTYMVTSIEAYAFNGCHQLSGMVIGDHITSIGEGAFTGCYSLESVTVGNNVPSIDDQTFSGCTSLVSVTIGSGVRTIGSEAFIDCNALDTVKCIGTVPPVMASTDCFTTEAYNNATLLVPRQFIETYQSTDYWYMFAHIEGWPSVDSGDVNGDGNVNTADVAAFINLLLTGGTPSAAADVNHDGMVNTGDIAALIRYLLSGTW